MKNLLLSASLALVTLLTAAPARADLMPPAGAAGVAGSEAGGSAGADAGGAAGAEAGGAAGASAGASAGGASGSGTSGQAGAPTTSSDEDESGCSVAGAGRQGAVAGLMLGLGALVLLVDRRRKA